MEFTDEQRAAMIDYAVRYGGRCRDCADTKVEGICDTKGLPCDPAITRAVLAHAFKAWTYGIKHGFTPNPSPAVVSKST